MSEIQKRDDTTPAPVEGGDSVLNMIARAASDPNVDIDKFERLMAMQERMILGNAEEAFNEAMTAAQMEMEPIAADSNNPQTKSKYASYAALDKVVRPIYSKHGFALSYNTGKADKAEDVRVICLVSRGRFTREYSVDMPADGKGAKGGDVMTKTHATGSALTYGQRYLLGLIFNLAVTGKRDDDGNAAGRTAASSPKITEDQVKELLKLLEETDYPAEKFCEFFKPPVDSVAEVLAKDFAAAKGWLIERKTARANAANSGVR